jgi:hypothetical protein
MWITHFSLGNIHQTKRKDLFHCLSGHENRSHICQKYHLCFLKYRCEVSLGSIILEVMMGMYVSVPKADTQAETYMPAKWKHI